MATTGRPQDHFVGQHYAAQDAAGPVPFLNPTKRTFTLPGPDAKTSARPGAYAGQEPVAEPPGGRRAEPAAPTGIYHVWRSRDNRKGRHAVTVTPGHAEASEGQPALRDTETLSQSWRGIWNMFVRYPVWDVSYDVAVVFTLGASAKHANCTSLSAAWTLTAQKPATPR